MDGIPTRKYIVCVHACVRILLLNYSQSEIAANNYPHPNRKKKTTFSYNMSEPNFTAKHTITKTSLGAYLKGVGINLNIHITILIYMHVVSIICWKRASFK